MRRLIPLGPFVRAERIVTGRRCRARQALDIMDLPDAQRASYGDWILETVEGDGTALELVRQGDFDRDWRIVVAPRVH